MTTEPKPPSGALAKAPEPKEKEPAKPKRTLAELVKLNEAGIASALPRHLDQERFTRVALTALRENPQLGQCTPESFLGALMNAAQLGLEPNTPLGHAYLVPYKRDCTFILGYKGMIDLARRSGVSIVARTAYEGDRFHVRYGLDEAVEHEPTLDDSERGDPVAYYAIARWDGGHLVHVATPGDIEERRARSASANAKTSPWKTDYEAMARKTVVRMMAPYLPLSVEMATAVASDDQTIKIDNLDVIDIDDGTDEEPTDAEVVEEETE